MRPALWIIAALLFAFPFADSAVALEKKQGKITLSSGEKFEGEFGIQAKIKFYPETKKKSTKIMQLSLEEISKITVNVDYAELEETYYFPEEGKKIKEKTGKFAPRKKFSLSVILSNGEELKGSATFQIYLLLNDENPRRFDVLKDVHGKEGQKLEDLIHVTEIILGEAKEKNTGCIKGKINVGEKLESVIAYARKHKKTFEGSVDVEKSTYEIKNLPDDIFDLCIVCEKTIYLDAGALKPENSDDESDKALIEKDIADINDKIQSQIGHSEFFDRIRVLATDGWLGSAIAVLLKERIKETHLDSTDKEHQHLPRRYEIWLMHKSSDDWKIDDRIFLFREVLVDDATGHLPEIREELKNIDINKDQKTKEVNLEKVAGEVK